MTSDDDDFPEIIKEVHEKASKAIVMPPEETIVLSLRIPLSPTENTTITYLDQGSNTHGIDISELPESEELMRNLSNLIRSAVSDLSFSNNCDVTSVRLVPKEGGKIKLNLEFSVVQSTQKSLIALAHQYLPGDLRSNPNIWVDEITPNVFGSTPNFILIKLLTDDKDLYDTQLKPRSDIDVPILDKITKQTTAPYTAPYKTLPQPTYKMRYELNGSPTFRTILFKYLHPIFSRYSNTNLNSNFKIQKLHLNPRQSTGKLEAELSIPL